jgi:hypothetical protein
MNRFVPLHSVRHEIAAAYAGLCRYGTRLVRRDDDRMRRLAGMAWHGMGSALGALVQANLRHWFYLRQIGLPTLSSTDRRIESVAREGVERTTRR